MKNDMTKGNPLKLIVLFAIPLFLSNLFQQFYNLADTAIVGHILGDHALSSVGAVSSVYNLMTSLCFGMSSGYSILVSQYFGAGNDAYVKKTIAHVVELSVASSVIMTSLGLTLLKPLMHLINVSDSLFDDGHTYISIIVAGLTVSTFYNMFSSVLRALGNSKTPLVFLIISSVINIGLDILFIGYLNMGIAGAAYATLLSQLISVILCVVYVFTKCRDLLPSASDFKLDKRLVSKLLSSGFAMALMFAIVNLGSVVLQSGINSFEDDIVAAHVTARKISEIFMMPVTTLSATMVTFCGQNYGAERLDRVWEGVKIAHIAGFIWAGIGLVLVILFGRDLVHALTGTSNTLILDTASRYLNMNLPFYVALVILCVLRSSLQGIERRGITVFGSILEMVGKISTVMFFVGRFGYNAIIFCEPVIWVICCFPVAIAFLTDKNMKKAWSIRK